MSTTPIDFSSVGGKPVSAAPIDFSSIGGKPVQASTPAPRTWNDSVSDFGKELWNQVNPVAGIKGAAQLTNHPIDSLKSDAGTRQDIYKSAEDAFKKGNYAEGAAHLLYAAIPFIGPQLDAAGNNFVQGHYAKGAGASVGMGLAAAAPEAISKLHPIQAMKEAIASTGAPERMYESALKPSTTIDATKRAAMVQTGLQNEIPVSASGMEKLGNLVDDLNKNIKDTIDAGNQAGQTVNKYAVASRLSGTVNKFARQVTPLSDLANISDTGNEFLNTQPTNIPASDAQALKQGTYQQLKGRAYGELKSATIESQKALARGIKEELVNQFPELKDLNSQESQLLNLDPILELAVNRISNHQIIGIGTPIAAGAAKAVTGSTGVGAVAGLMKAVFDDPMIKSKLAIALAKKGVPATNAATRLAAYSSALGNAASGGANADQEGQQ